MRSLQQFTRVTPFQPSFNNNGKRKVYNLKRTVQKRGYPKQILENDFSKLFYCSFWHFSKETQKASKKLRRQIWLSLLLCGISALIIGLSVFIGISISQKMTGSSNNHSINCDPNCENNGTCISNNVCECPTGYNGSYCENLICNQPCIFGNCSAPDVCTCVPGYNGSTCADAICPSNCVPGTCSAPFTCTCATGWSGANCTNPVCTPACINGICSSPNTCTCNSGWTGSTCNSAICSSSCLNGGGCIAPNTCTCPNGYNGSLCQYPICSQSCQNNGTCTAPNTCICVAGYNGTNCQYPICNTACLNGGTCAAPNTCQCIPDVWTGPICQTPIRILWTFDNNLGDFYNNYPGVGINSPTYSSPGINGYGKCLYLDAAANQSVTIYSPPFLNMAFTSFSLVAWVKPTTLRNGSQPFSDCAIFGQYQNSTQDHLLHILIRNQKIYFGFFADDTQGNRTLYPGNWYHMAYVYDYSTLTQSVYVNGILDVSNSPKGPYQGTSGSLTIGTNAQNFPYNYWDGCLDLITYSARAKNQTEILLEATLTVQYTFDNTLLDSGPLGINGTGSNYSYSNAGRINQCLALLTNGSYVQATGLVLLGTTGQSYSFSVWIKPTITTKGTIFHVSQNSTGAGWCIPMLGFTNTSAIGIQGWNISSVGLTGPFITVNVWTHIAMTYSSTNGLRLWINGIQYGSGSGPYIYEAANAPVTVTIGSSLLGITFGCMPGVINMGQYFGYIDQFQLYSRELSSTDIYNLANP